MKKVFSRFFIGKRGLPFFFFGGGEARKVLKKSGDTKNFLIFPIHVFPRKGMYLTIFLFSYHRKFGIIYFKFFFNRSE